MQLTTIGQVSALAKATLLATHIKSQHLVSYQQLPLNQTKKSKKKRRRNEMK
jgi:hypothetical protein